MVKDPRPGYTAMSDRPPRAKPEILSGPGPGKEVKPGPLRQPQAAPLMRRLHPLICKPGLHFGLKVKQGIHCLGVRSSFRNAGHQ